MNTLRYDDSLAKPLNSGEIGRKTFHIASGLLAFGLVYIGPKWGMIGAIIALVVNSIIAPALGGRAMWRPRETERGYSVGLIAYPITVLVLILLFRERLEVAAAAWGILAFGDGSASLIGMSMGRHRLPWNRSKSWEGSVAYWIFGSAGATALLLWTAPELYDLPAAFALSAGVALLSAVLESLSLPVDDNISVPLVAGAALYGLVLLGGY